MLLITIKLFRVAGKITTHTCIYHENGYELKQCSSKTLLLRRLSHLHETKNNRSHATVKLKLTFDLIK